MIQEKTLLKHVRGVRWLRRIRERFHIEKGAALHLPFTEDYDPAVEESWHVLCELEDELIDTLLDGI